MKEQTAVIFGSGPIVHELAPRFLRCPEKFVFFGVRRFLGELNGLLGEVDGIRPLRLQESLQKLQSANATNVVFIGGAGDFLDYAQGRMGFLPDRMLWSYMKRTGTFAPPQMFLEGVRLALADNGIELRSAVDVFPDLALSEGFFVGDGDTKKLMASIQVAKTSLKEQPLSLVRQSCIVRNSDVLDTEYRGTDSLITSYKRHDCMAGDHVILVKCAVEPFAKIDAPVIGIHTLNLALENGLVGFAVEAHKTVVLQQKDLAARCAQEGFFIYAFE